MKMKKSLLIVPAMATMLLAAAGSVGGTVAWFSANTTYEMTAGKFAVGALDGNLNVTLTNIHGTTCNSEDKVVSLVDGDLIADASFDHKTRQLFTDESNVNGVAKKFTLLDTMTTAGALGNESKWYAKENFSDPLDMHWAIAWKMAFTYSMPSTGIQQNLYFDNESSGALTSVTKGNNGAALFTYKGFRIVFVPLDSTNTTPVARVWAPYTTETTAANLHYVNAAQESVADSGDNISNYDDGELILKAGEGTLTPAKTAGTSKLTGANYLGNFNGGHANTDLTMNFACVAWFEGTDDNVRSAASKDVIASLAMNFYVLPNA